MMWVCVGWAHLSCSFKIDRSTVNPSTTQSGLSDTPLEVFLQELSDEKQMTMKLLIAKVVPIIRCTYPVFVDNFRNVSTDSSL